MTLNEIKELKSFPRGKEVIEYKDRATLTLFKRVVSENEITGKKNYEYEASIEFTYPTNAPRSYVTLKRSKVFKSLLKSAITLYETRNNQMLRREPTLL